MSPHQNRVAGWVNSHGAPLLHGQGHQRRSLSGEGEFVQGLSADHWWKRLNWNFFLHKELVDTSWQFCPESQKGCHIMLHNCQTQNNWLFTLWSATARTIASSSRAMPVITTMNHSSRTTGWPPWPPSARSPPPPPAPPGGVRLGESAGNCYLLHILYCHKM